MRLERDDHPVPFDPFLMKGGSPGKWDLILLFIPDDGGGDTSTEEYHIPLTYFYVILDSIL